MKRVYDYICRTCWHQWKAKKVQKVCPKCGGVLLDVETELKED